jgi:hypothetical protein
MIAVTLVADLQIDIRIGHGRDLQAVIGNLATPLVDERIAVLVVMVVTRRAAAETTVLTGAAITDSEAPPGVEAAAHLRAMIILRRGRSGLSTTVPFHPTTSKVCSLTTNLATPET